MSATPALASALHPDILVLDQPSRTLLRAAVRATDQAQRHRSAADLEAAINTYIQARNADPKPFRWTKTSNDILAAVERFCRRTLAVHAKVE